jgi:hypothetical protein
VGIHTGRADDSILDAYDEVRRRIWHDIIDPISSDNMTQASVLQEASVLQDGASVLQDGQADHGCRSHAQQAMVAQMSHRM